MYPRVATYLNSVDLPDVSKTGAEVEILNHFSGLVTFKALNNIKIINVSNFKKKIVQCQWILKQAMEVEQNREDFSWDHELRFTKAL